MRLVGISLRGIRMVFMLMGGYLEVVNNVISDNSGWGMYLYGVNSGIARGNLVSGNGL